MSAGLISEQQLEEALRAQVMWGGRLGTNLVELGAVSLDELSKALGKQHGMPAALGAHFGRADRELQNKLHPDLAEKFQCLPLVRAGKRIVIAASSPLSDKAVALVAGELDINRQMIVQSIAAEMRVKFQLERLYDISRGQRFLRSRGVTDQSSLFSLPALARDAGPAAVAAAAATAKPSVPTRKTLTIEEAVSVDEMIDAPAQVESPRVHDSTVERRTYLRTLADMLSKHPDRESALARVQRTRNVDHVRPLAIGTSPMVKVDAAVIADSLDAALADIALAENRDDLARRAIGTVARFVPESHSALLLVVRGEAAVSWTSFCRDGTELPALAVPLNHPGLCAAVMRRKVMTRNASGDLGPIDYLLLASLGMQFGDLVVAPVRIADHVIGMIVLATEHRAAVSRVDEITAATSDAFQRLMKNAGN